MYKNVYIQYTIYRRQVMFLFLRVYLSSNLMGEHADCYDSTARRAVEMINTVFAEAETQSSQNKTLQL